MSVSLAPVTGSTVTAKSSSSYNSGDSQSKQLESGAGGASADPRPAKNLSPRSADALFAVSSTKSSGSKTDSNPNIDSEITYHTAYMDDDEYVDLPEISVTTPAPSNGIEPGSTIGNGEPVGGGGSPSTTDTSGSTTVVDDGSYQITLQEASEVTYQSLFSENPQRAKVGDENQGAVAVDRSSGQSSDGSIWSEGKIIFKTSKGVFWASPSTPGGVIFARIVNGSLDVSSGHKA